MQRLIQLCLLSKMVYWNVKYVIATRNKLRKAGYLHQDLPPLSAMVAEAIVAFSLRSRREQTLSCLICCPQKENQILHQTPPAATYGPWASPLLAVAFGASA